MTTMAEAAARPAGEYRNVRVETRDGVAVVLLEDEPAQHVARDRRAEDRFPS